MHLLDLPIENLHLILACIERADIVNVALCCKHLRSLSEWPILRLRYGRLDVGGSYEEHQTKVLNARSTPLGALYGIVSNPSIIPHVFRLDFHGFYYECCKVESTTASAILTGIRDALIRSECFGEPEIRALMKPLFITRIKTQLLHYSGCFCSILKRSN